MRFISQALDRFWFKRAPATRLGLLRLLLGVYTLVYLAQRYKMFMKIAHTDPALFRPVGAVSYLKRPISARAFRRVLLATLIANVAFALGVRHRFSGPLFAGLLLWLLCYRNSWSMMYHSDNTLVLHTLILGLTPSADAVSIDALTRSAAHRRQPGTSWQYGWPIQLMNTVTTLTYFLAGVAKVKGPLGWRWASGEVLRSQIAVDALRKETLGGSGEAPRLIFYDQVPLLRALALGSLVTELAAPVAIVDRRLGRLWVLGAFLMHWGIYAMMRIKFRYQLSGLLFASFFDVERLTVIFDGS